MTTYEEFRISLLSHIPNYCLASLIDNGVDNRLDEEPIKKCFEIYNKKGFLTLNEAISIISNQEVPYGDLIGWGELIKFNA